jgi:choline dehydrogenase-like flavoprotein
MLKDASIVPTIPDANTHATVVMVGEKAADLIRAPTPRGVVGEARLMSSSYPPALDTPNTDDLG